MSSVEETRINTDLLVKKVRDAVRDVPETEPTEITPEDVQQLRDSDDPALLRVAEIAEIYACD